MYEESCKKEEIKVENATDNSAAPKRKALPIVIGCTVVAVIAVAGAGFIAWHEQPSFCNAICHTPMDPYVSTLTDGATDKYGNELASEAEKTSMLSYAHANIENGDAIECLDCHVPTLGEQVSEGLSWATGNYTVKGTNANGQAFLESRSLEDLVEARGLEPDQFCLNDACHTSNDGSVLTREDLVALTADEYGDLNPHEAVHEELACGTCHKAHTQSVNYCSNCHDDAKIPDGWLSAQDYASLPSME